MNKTSKTLTIFFIAVFIVGVSIFMVETNVLENSYYSRVTIDESNKINTYNSGEDIILSGTAAPETEILLSWNNQLGLVQSNKNGKWAVNIGKMPEGRYNLQMLSSTSSNIRSVATAQIIVDNSSIAQKTQTSFVQNLFNNLTASISFNSKVIPEILLITPQSTPSTLQDGFN
jgi:hypothetical protein